MDTYPPTCPRGHPAAPVVMTLSWVSCDCPAAMAGAHGHHVRICWQTPTRAKCSEDLPVEHTGPERDQR